MSNLKQYSELFADLAQSAYTNRPNNFAEYKTWNPEQREQEHYGSAILFEFSKRSGGSNLGEKGGSIISVVGKSTMEIMEPF